MRDGERPHDGGEHKRCPHSPPVPTVTLSTLPATGTEGSSWRAMCICSLGLKSVITFIFQGKFPGEAKAQRSWWKGGPQGNHTVRTWFLQCQDMPLDVGLQACWLSCHPERLSPTLSLSCRSAPWGRGELWPMTHELSPRALLKVHASATLPRLPQYYSPCGTVMWWGPSHWEGSSPHLELAPQVGHLIQPVLLHTSAAAPLSRVSTPLRLHLVEGQTSQSENLASSGSKPQHGRL